MLLHLFVTLIKFDEVISSLGVAFCMDCLICELLYFHKITGTTQAIPH